MAYNSDGYIMLDFTEVDFRRTNQTIEGLFDRCQKVIGTNKFVIVINANNKTPLPSTVCITNGQYVIESVLFTFSISSTDNLHITKKTTPEELIDDNHVTLKTTFSSNKIMSLLEGTIVKSFKYIGANTLPGYIQFPEKPTLVLGIFASGGHLRFEVMPFIVDMPGFMSVYIQPSVSSAPTTRSTECSYDDDTNILTVNGQYVTYAMNVGDIEYTVYYI